MIRGIMRQGNKKVKTGCLTCKIRKIKCDETWPVCRRCSSTGRKCDGYKHRHVPRESSNPRVPLPTPVASPSTQSPLPMDERRALNYFHRVISPRLSSARDGYFWTHLVMQVSESEAVVKHTILAVSSLYEAVEAQKAAPYAKTFALQNYTAAIQQLKSIRSEPLVLLVCILFICVEYLQSNNKIALQHCQHGLAIMDKCSNPWARQYLLPIFSRITAVPMLFGPEDVETKRMPALSCTIPSKFYCIEDAQYMMDDIFNRMVRLCFLKQRGVPSDTSEEQNIITSQLQTWQTLFEKLEVDPTSLLYQDQEASLFLRVELCRIELSADYRINKNIDTFRRTLQLANPSSQDSRLRMPQSTFELAYTPMLFFVTMRCPDLEIRLTSLRLMKQLRSPKEGLCENLEMLSTSRQIIQEEHGVRLDCFDNCEVPAFET